MWNRKKVKERGKQRFTQNYWKALLAGLVLSIALSGTSKINQHFGPDDFPPHVKGEITHSDENFPFDDNDWDDFKYDLKYELNDIPDMKEAVDHALNEFDTKLGSSFIRTAIAIFSVFAFFAFAISTCIKIFLINPLQLGGRNFYLKNLNQDADLKELGSGFTKNYSNGVKTLFFRDLYIFLWSLLLVIPGIIKKYEYLMIPYLLAKNPDMDTKEAFAVSKQMMMGQKWNAFVLDLSFIGWHLLNGLSCGILGIFFVNPYKYQTDAALFEALDSNSPVDPVNSSYESYIEVE